MRRTLALLLLAALAGTASSQITSGYYSDGTGYTARVEVSDTNGAANPGVDVTVTDSGGSAVANGSQASGSTDANPSASSFSSTTTPRGTAEVRGHNGKVQKKNAAGQWVDMRKVKKPKRGVQRPAHFTAGTPGHPSASLPPAPAPSSSALTSSPGEEVTSLPGPGQQNSVSSPEEGGSLPH